MVEAGTHEKGDAWVLIEPSERREVIVKSKLERLYGNAIRETIESMTSNIKAKIVVEDYGALDWVLRARVESALRKYRGEQQ